MYRDPVYFKIISSNDLVEYMADYIFKQYREYVMVNEGVIIEILDDNKIFGVLLKFKLNYLSF